MNPADSQGWVRTVTLAPPALDNNTADADRLAAELKTALNTAWVQIDLETIKHMPDQLRRWGFRATAVLFKASGDQGILVHLAPPDSDQSLCGLAVDLGTTRVVLRLIDLVSGNPLGETVFDNPQIAVGPDILSRIHHVEIPGGREQLTALIVDGINAQLADLCRQCGVGTDTIHLVSIAGNTTMTHLLLGLNPRWMIREPYIPAINRPGVYPTADIGLKVHATARAMVFPNVGSYFGGDLIAGILYSDMDRREETSILVDVGTNAEVIVGNRHWMMACAGAAGPALEGGVTRMGTTAAPGVIDRIRFDEHRSDFDIHTIGDLPPRGICGSGVIDLAAALFQSGMIDIRGNWYPSGAPAGTN